LNDQEVSGILNVEELTSADRYDDDISVWARRNACIKSWSLHMMRIFKIKTT
jgi:hypothetical protein